MRKSDKTFSQPNKKYYCSQGSEKSSAKSGFSVLSFSTFERKNEDIFSYCKAENVIKICGS